MSKATTKPTPGSDEAVAAGCKCPRLDNAYGRGYFGGIKDATTGDRVFVVNENCRMHGKGASR